MAGAKPKGRPARPMPPKIDASPETIAEVVLQVSHKEVVALLEQAETAHQEEADAVHLTSSHNKG